MKASHKKFFIYLLWCKRCGNCVAFCPRQALAQDEWGHPFLAQPEACTACGLCQMLCPDFAISLGQDAPHHANAEAEQSKLGATSSPERLTPAPQEESHG